MNQHLPEQYLLFGNPVSHSKSPFIHTLFSRQTMQNMEYRTHKSEEGNFLSDVNHFFKSGGKGCNVTAPFKEQAYEFADRLTERAELAGAVNTLKELDDGGILGDNTDGAGFLQDLFNYQEELKGARVLLLGAGGAARGIIEPILSQLPQELVVSNRTMSKAGSLVELFTASGNIIALSEKELTQPFDFVINATSSNFSQQRPMVSNIVFGKNTVSYDLNYANSETEFNCWARDSGAIRAYDGLGMLVGQASESFMLWRGLRPGTKQVLRELRKNLQGD